MNGERSTKNFTESISFHFLYANTKWIGPSRSPDLERMWARIECIPGEQYRPQFAAVRTDQIRRGEISKLEAKAAFFSLHFCFAASKQSV